MQQEIDIILKKNKTKQNQTISTQNKLEKKAEQDTEWLTLENNKIVTIQRKIQYQHRVHLDWEKCNNE